MSGMKFFFHMVLLGVMIATLFKVYHDYQQKTLYQAVSVADTAKVVRLLAQGVKADYRNTVNTTALMRAATLTQNDILKSLIDYNADIDSVDDYGNTALFFAVNANNAPAIELLIESGADINHKNNKGQTALHLAVELSHLAATKALLENNADVGQRTESDSNIEAIAQKSASKEILYTIEASLYDWLPIHMAAAKGDIFTVMRQVNSGTDINLITKREHTALSLAIREGHHDIAEFLLDHGASYSLKNDHGQALLKVARKKLVGNTSLLIESRIDGWNDLMLAAATNQQSRLKALLLEKSDTEYRSHYERTALTIAVNQGQLDSVKILLEAGAMVNVQDRFGWTPLMYASHLGYVDITRYLLQKSARIDYYTKDCKSAVRLSVERLSRDNSTRTFQPIVGQTSATFIKQLENDSVLQMLRKAGDVVKPSTCQQKTQQANKEVHLSTDNWLANTPVSLLSSL